MFKDNEFDEVILKYGPWSVSKRGLLEQCPRAFHFKYVERVPEQQTNKHARIGSTLHSVLENCLLEDSTSRTTEFFDGARDQNALVGDEVDEAADMLPNVMAFVERISEFRRRADVVELRVETELGMTADFRSCGYSYYDSWIQPKNRVFLRGKVDLLMHTRRGAVIVMDHKTGKPKPSSTHAGQLYAYAILANLHFPESTAVQCAINYLAESEPRMMAAMPSNRIEKELHPWLVNQFNKLANDLRNVEDTGRDARVSPSALCAYCNFLEVCPDGQDRVSERGSKRLRVVR